MYVFVPTLISTVPFALPEILTIAVVLFGYVTPAIVTLIVGFMAETVNAGSMTLTL